MHRSWLGVGSIEVSTAGGGPGDALLHPFRPAELGRSRTRSSPRRTTSGQRPGLGVSRPTMAHPAASAASSQTTAIYHKSRGAPAATGCAPSSRPFRPPGNRSEPPPSATECRATVQCPVVPERPHRGPGTTAQPILNSSAGRGSALRLRLVPEFVTSPLPMGTEPPVWMRRQRPPIWSSRRLQTFRRQAIL
jgi:hypothetical protein